MTKNFEIKKHNKINWEFVLSLVLAPLVFSSEVCSSDSLKSDSLETLQAKPIIQDARMRYKILRKTTSLTMPLTNMGTTTLFGKNNCIVVTKHTKVYIEDGSSVGLVYNGPDGLDLTAVNRRNVNCINDLQSYISFETNEILSQFLDKNPDILIHTSINSQTPEIKNGDFPSKSNAISNEINNNWLQAYKADKIIDIRATYLFHTGTIFVYTPKDHIYSVSGTSNSRVVIDSDLISDPHMRTIGFHSGSLMPNFKKRYFEKVLDTTILDLGDLTVDSVDDLLNMVRGNLYYQGIQNPNEVLFDLIRFLHKIIKKEINQNGHSASLRVLESGNIEFIIKHLLIVNDFTGMLENDCGILSQIQVLTLKMKFLQNIDFLTKLLVNNRHISYFTGFTSENIGRLSQDIQSRVLE